MFRTIVNMIFNLLLGTILLAFLPAVFSQFVDTAADFFRNFAWHPIVIGTGLGLVVERFLSRHIPEM